MYRSSRRLVYRARAASAQALRGTAAKKPKGMSIAQWQAAFRRYQVAAAILGQWSLGGSWAHVEICSQIAASASTHRRRADLAVLFDELARRARASARPHRIRSQRIPRAGSSGQRSCAPARSASPSRVSAAAWIRPFSAWCATHPIQLARAPAQLCSGAGLVGFQCEVRRQRHEGM